MLLRPTGTSAARTSLSVLPLAGPIEGYLCFILPEEKAFSTYYKITCEVR